MGTDNIHHFRPAIANAPKAGLRFVKLAVCEAPPKDRPRGEPLPETPVLRTGGGLLFGSPRGVVKVGGEDHYRLFAARDGKLVGDDVRAMFAAEDDGPLVVTNKNPESRAYGNDVAFEGTVVNIGPRQYTISSRKESDDAHLIHVRTGVVRAKDPATGKLQSYEDALSQFFTEYKVGELGYHGSFALDLRDVENVAEIEDYGEYLLPEAHLKWNVARTGFDRRDGIRVPVSREDAWKVPEGCSLLVVDPTVDENGRQRCFTLRVENGRLITHQGGKQGLDRFMGLEAERLEKRAAERAARKAAKEGGSDS